MFDIIWTNRNVNKIFLDQFDVPIKPLKVLYLHVNISKKNSLLLNDDESVVENCAIAEILCFYLSYNWSFSTF